MKGFVPTPPSLVDTMVARLFASRPPRASDTLLDPGCGTGAFLEGVLRWCSDNGAEVPQLTGVESDPRLLEQARNRLSGISQVTYREADFLDDQQEHFDFIVGNPPYVPITGLDEAERSRYRQRYQTAQGRFDLYLLFFEQALRVLKPDGRLVFITPEKFLYVQTAAPLRRQLGSFAVEEITLVDESAFGDLVTYPTITTVTGRRSSLATRVTLRDGTVRHVQLQQRGSSWLPGINGIPENAVDSFLSEAFVRISCGVATGADSVFVMKDGDVPDALRKFAYPTIAGRQLRQDAGLMTSRSMLVPYDRTGALHDESAIPELIAFLKEPTRHSRLMARTCVPRKPWYAFHETPPMAELLTPKILCKDISSRPWFIADETGTIIPQHSVYYLVPKDSAQIRDLVEYLNSDAAKLWLTSHCQRAANGFIRLQSHVLKRLPLPANLSLAPQLPVFESA